MKYTKQRGDFETAFILALLVVLLVAMFGISSCSCSARWTDSGLESDYGPIQGCKVKMPDGRWLPDDRVRDIDIKPEGAP